jgi:hypothetical protein
MTLSPATAPGREFTDTFGRTIEAEIDSVRAPNVVLVKDGKTFLFPFSKLSEDDQAYVRQWMDENPEIKLEYRFEKEKISSEGSSKRKKEKWAYKVTVNNRSLQDLDGVTFEYTIFKQLSDRTSTKKKSISGTAEGKHEVTIIERQRSHIFKTKPIQIEKVNIVTKIETGVKGVYDSSFEKWSETLIGIKITAKRGDKVVDQKEYGVTK